MKKCRSCQKEIDVKAKKCPYCQEKQGNWAQRHPILTGILGIIVFFIVMGAVSGGGETPSSQSGSSTSTEEVQADSQEAPAEETSTMTASQRNAVRKAESYLDYTGFSRSGLIKQLEFEKFSTEDATFAVDNIDVDWNEQAAKKAKSYDDYTGFSRDGMIKQLTFEGFTAEQAAYGADSLGL